MADEEGLLCKLLHIPHCMSLYMDDVILFLKASVNEAHAVKELLDIFGGSTGLCCNLSKSSISPILTQGDLAQDICNILCCQVKHFPIRYLGLPLHFRKIRKADLRAVIDIVRNKLANWRTYFLTQGAILWCKQC